MAFKQGELVNFSVISMLMFCLIIVGGKRYTLTNAQRWHTVSRKGLFLFVFFSLSLPLHFFAVAVHTLCVMCKQMNESNNKNIEEAVSNIQKSILQNPELQKVTNQRQAFTLMARAQKKSVAIQTQHNADESMKNARPQPKMLSNLLSSDVLWQRWCVFLGW